MKNISHSDIAEDQEFIIQSRCELEITTEICPWCLNMIRFVEDITTECSVCRRGIRMEDLEANDEII